MSDQILASTLMEMQNKLSISHWTTWENKMVASHESRRALNILLAGLILCLDVKLLTVMPNLLESMAELILDTIPEDYLWLLISMLLNGNLLMICLEVLIEVFFI